MQCKHLADVDCGFRRNPFAVGSLKTSRVAIAAAEEQLTALALAHAIPHDVKSNLVMNHDI
jgi:hypothetical protein